MVDYHRPSQGVFGVVRRVSRQPERPSCPRPCGAESLRGTRRSSRGRLCVCNMAGTKEGRAAQLAKAAGLTVEEYAARVSIGFLRCSKCGEWKEHSEYHRNAASRSGRSNNCKQCLQRPRRSLKGRPSYFKGRSHTPQARATMSEQRKGNKRALGHRKTWETRQKLREIALRTARRGPANNNWKGGRSSEVKAIRQSAEYRMWRATVFECDGYRCRDCGDSQGGNLEAHHLVARVDRPDLVFVVDNGLTLCRQCHRLRHYKPDSIRNKAKERDLLQLSFLLCGG